jgi:hypothetical protein
MKTTINYKEIRFWVVFLVFMAVFIIINPSCKKEKQTIVPSNLAIILTDYSDCKLKDGTYTDSVSTGQSCVDYILCHDTLYITHINAGFNCCIDTINLIFSTSGDTLVIQEVENYDQPCDCLCLFDVNILITGIEPGDYYIRFIEPLATGNNEELEFGVTIQENVPGTYCVNRTAYPWGM